MNKEQEKKLSKLIQPLVEQIVKKQKLNEGKFAETEISIRTVKQMDLFIYGLIQKYSKNIIKDLEKGTVLIEKSNTNPGDFTDKGYHDRIFSYLLEEFKSRMSQELDNENPILD